MLKTSSEDVKKHKIKENQDVAAESGREVNMKIVFSRQKAAASLAPLMNATTGRSAVSTSDGFLIEASAPDKCVFTAYDLEKGMRTNVEAKVIEGGSYIINAQKFLQTLRVMEGEDVTLTVDEKLSACISSGKSSHKMNAMRGEDFPKIPELKSQLGFEIPQASLRSMIGKTMYAIGVNDQRQVLNGCYFRIVDKNLMLVSCDSFKLAKCSTETELENRNSDGSRVSFSFIVPVKTVNELYKLLSDDEEATTRIYMMRKHIIMELGDIIFFSRLIEGEYIDYDRIILKNHKIVAVTDRDELISALERAALVTEERIAGSVRSHVKLEFVGDILKITANSAAGSTYDELNIEHEGNDICIAFNNRYLLDSLRSCPGDKVKLSLSSPLTSMNIQPAKEEEGSEDVFMLLPVRMKD